MRFISSVGRLAEICVCICILYSMAMARTPHAQRKLRVNVLHCLLLHFVVCAVSPLLRVFYYHYSFTHLLIVWAMSVHLTVDSILG